MTEYVQVPRAALAESLEILRNVDTQFRATGQPSARIEQHINFLAGLDAEPVRAWLATMVTSAGTEYYVCVGRHGGKFGDGYLTPHKYSIKGRAEYDVAEWNHLLLGDPEPDIMNFNTDEPAPVEQVARETGLYFCYDGHSFDTYPTLAEAKQNAEEALQYFADDAGDGWDELVEQVCYGMVTGEVFEAERRPRNSDDYGVDSGIDLIVDYQLRDIPNAAATIRQQGDMARAVTLTFDTFRNANVARCVKWHPEGIASWSPSDWLTAVTGELGELASLLKMRNRERDGLPGNKFSPTDKMIADELADVLTYLDLLAAVLGVDLGHAAVSKFNEVSERVGFPDRIHLASPAKPSDGVSMIAAERRRHVEVEGWTPERDDRYEDHQLSQAAACYCIGLPFAGGEGDVRVQLWPWDMQWWKPKDRLHDLARAGALIAAEIDRIRRVEAELAGSQEQAHV